MNTDNLILKYLDVWNERDDAARMTLMKSVLTDDSLYTDPDNAGLRGHAELSKVIGKAQPSFGDLLFTLDTVISTHHDHALFTWRLGTVATGYDVVEFSGGRISRIIGFFV
ncbi:hypothetical protein DMB42_42520 [Nonomuraea sp. WAC 01424]|uniref:nuclear transport factor 2 family protein n=1 Tax=Nonomuraea sp. WAC 01424 TaxID=2203200 RepID=UPI000F793716|nr:nuclear transport factor 2 family protein [Nonomuraea sp. WAC 01424]RSM99571.1 hypothetical protein DMB42_42520 [Nonomuraea sp. WAC 01424]